MKKEILLTGLAFAALLSGCSDNETIVQNEDNRVKLFISGVMSRVATTGNATVFETGDQIAITSDGLSPDMDNEIFTVSEDGSLEADLSFYYNGSKSASFYAHYPTTATVNEGVVTHTVPGTQNSEDVYNANDFMTATAIGNAGTEGGAVSLKFAHRLSLVKIVWAATATATDIELSGIKPTVNWIQEADSTYTDGEAGSILTWRQGNTQEYWALIPSQTIAKGTKFLDIYDGDKKYPYYPNTDLTFNGKQVKKITLNTKEYNGVVEVVATSITIDDWTEGEEVTEDSLVSIALPTDTLIYPDWGKFVGVDSLVALEKKNTQAGVWGFDADSVSTIELVACPADETAKAIHFNVAQYLDADSTTATKWYQNAMYYQLADSVAKGIKPNKHYMLKFKIRSTSADKKQLRLNVMQANLDNNFFAITTNPDYELNETYTKENADGTTSTLYRWVGTQYPFPATADTYEEKTYYVNFSRIVQSGTGNIVRETPGSIADFGHIAICFAVNNGYGIDFHVKDIELVEYVPE